MPRATTPSLDYRSSFELPSAITERPAAPDRGRSLDEARAPPQATSSTAGSAWSARTATTCCSPSARPGEHACRSRATPRTGSRWSFALALRLASYDLLRADGDDPILVLDDVFAELDTERRAQLAELVAGAEQVLVTAAVAADVPEALAGARYTVAGGEVTRDE